MNAKYWLISLLFLAKIVAFGQTVPPAPTGLRATFTDCGKINLAWDNYPSGVEETGFEVFVYDNKQFNQSRKIGETTANVTSFDDLGHFDNKLGFTSIGESYRYYILGKFENIVSTKSNEASAIIDCQIIPSAPRISYAICGEIRLNWDDFASQVNETGYTILRANAPNGYYKIVGEVDSNVLEFSDMSSMQAGIQYFYQIRGKFNEIRTLPSLSIQTTMNCPVPNTPRLFSNNCNTNIIVWEPMSGGFSVSQYDIFISSTTIDGNYVSSNGVNGNVFKYDHRFVEKGKTYFYKIRAKIGNAFTVLSQPFEVLSSDCSNFPKIENFRITSTSCGAINLAWDNFPSGFYASGYYLKRYEINSLGEPINGQFININPNPVFSYSDTGNSWKIRKNTTYSYSVGTWINSIIETESQPIMASMTCEASGILNIQNGTNCQPINLSWSDFGPNFNETGYYIYRAENQDRASKGYFKIIGYVEANVFNYADSGVFNDYLNANNEYFYKVVAVNGNLEIESNTVAGFSSCESDITLNIVPNCNSMTLNWVDNQPNVIGTGYRIYRSHNVNDENYTFPIVDVSYNTNSFEITSNLKQGVSAFFKVSKLFNYIRSPYSNLASTSINCYERPTVIVTNSACGSISLNIINNVSNLEPSNLKVFRSLNGPNGYSELVSNSSSNISSFTDNASAFALVANNYIINYLPENQLIYYWVQLQYGEVVVENEFPVEASFNCPEINKITGLNSSESNCNIIKLKWESANYQGDDSFRYRVFKSKNDGNGPFELVKEFYYQLNLPEYIDDKNLTFGQSYHYKVQYVYNNVLSEMSDPISVNFQCLTRCNSVNSGLWQNPETWSCGRIPTSLDEILINNGHAVTIGTNLNANAKNLTNNGEIIFGENAILILNQN